jgi:hypothetical protein
MFEYQIYAINLLRLEEIMYKNNGIQGDKRKLFFNNIIIVL